MCIRYAAKKIEGEPLVASKRGRKSTFTSEEELQIIATTNKKAMEMQSLTFGDKGTLLDTMKETIRSNRSKGHANIEISAKQIQRFIRKHHLLRARGQN
jgi:hypothetical protein